MGRRRFRRSHYGGTMTDAKQLFMKGITSAAQGTVYVVEETIDGFDVSTNTNDDAWLATARESGVDSVYVHHVRVQGSAYRILDEVANLTWKSGKALQGRPRSATYSRATSLKANDAQLGSGAMKNGSDPRGGRQLIAAVGDQLGFIQHEAGSRVGLLLTGIAILLTVAIMFGVAIWVLFLN